MEFNTVCICIKKILNPDFLPLPNLYLTSLNFKSYEIKIPVNHHNCFPLFAQTILSAQGAPDEEEDSTMTFEQLEFEEALIEMFGGDFLSETESENTTLLSGAGKTDKQQIDELMQSAKLLYSNIYDESSMRIENGDTTLHLPICLIIALKAIL